MQDTKKRLIVVGGVVAAAMAGSALTAAPAFAADPLHGTVVDGAAPVANADVYLLKYDTVDADWDYSSYLGTTGADGTWSAGAGFDGSNLQAGKYALWYDVDYTTVLGSRAQASNGAATKDGNDDYQSDSVSNVAFPVDFTVTSGVATSTAFTVSLVRNAGAVTVALQDGTGGPINSSNASYGYVDLEDGYNSTTGPIYGIDYESDAPDFNGTVTVGHAVPGTYPEATVEADGFVQEALDPITITAGVTTSYGVATLQANGSPTVYDSESLPRKVTIAGVAKVGSVLTAVAPTSTNGTPFTVSYQWYEANLFASGGPFGGGVAIAGATAQTYVPTADRLGSQLFVVATLRQAGHVSNQVSSFTSPTDRVVAGDPNQAVVTVAGTAKFGSTLKATVTGGTVAGAANAGYQWYRNGAPISGADGSSYALTKSDVGQKVFASVTSFAQGHLDAVIPSNTVSVAKDAATVTIKKSTKGKKITLKVTLKNGKSGATATGKVKVYYTSTKSKTVTFGSKTTSKSVTLTTLKSGTIKVKYLGDTHYSAKNYKVKATK